MIAFVAGSTGYTGRAIVPQLCINHQCIAHIRPNSPSIEAKESFLKAGAVVDQSPWQLEALSTTLQKHQPDVLFSLLGTTKKRNRQDPSSSYSTVDRDLTLLLYQAACALTNKPTFVYLSSMGAEKPTGAYLKARYEVEQVLLTGELPYIIARPGFISGPDRLDFRLFERAACVASDSVLSVLALLGQSSLQHRFASLSATQLAAGLIEHSSKSKNTILYTSDLRLSS